MTATPPGMLDAAAANAYRPVSIEDVDRAVMRWFDVTVDAHVETPTSDRYKVPVIVGAGERWAVARDRKGVRDKDGRLILPVIVIRRKSIDPAASQLALAVNTPRMFVSRRVAQRTREMRSIGDARAAGSRAPYNGAQVYEVTTIPFPFSGVTSYELTVQAQYTLQMNAIVQKILSRLEWFQVPCFVATIDKGRSQIKAAERPAGIGAWDEPYFELRKPLTDYYVVGFFEPGMNDAGNFDEFTDQERIVKYTTSFRVPTYLHLDQEGTAPAARVEKTAFHVEFSGEDARLVDDPYELEIIFGSGK